MEQVTSSEPKPKRTWKEWLVSETAVAYMTEAQQLNEEGNQADDEANEYQKAAFILAIGLAITAWASLFDTRPKLRLIFTLIALPCLAIGLWLLLVTAIR